MLMAMCTRPSQLRLGQIGILGLVASLAFGCQSATSPPSARHPVPDPPPKILPPRASPSPARPARPAVVVFLRDTFVDAPLFEDEVERLEKIAIQRLESADHRLRFVSATELEELGRVARAGKLRAHGPRCAVPPSPAEVIHAAFPTLHVGQVSFRCWGQECSVRYGLYRGAHLGVPRPRDKVMEGLASPTDPVSETAWKTAMSTDGAVFKAKAVHERTTGWDTGPSD